MQRDFRLFCTFSHDNSDINLLVMVIVSVVTMFFAKKMSKIPVRFVKEICVIVLLWNGHPHLIRRKNKILLRTMQHLVIFEISRYLQ